MRTVLGRIRRAILLAVTWALAWAPLGILIGLIVDADGAMDEPWVAVGAFPGFFCGLVFCGVLEMTEGRRKLAELSLSRVGAWGAVSGLLVMVFVYTGLLGTPNTEHAFWRWRVMIIAVVTLMSAISGITSVLLARRTGRNRLA